MALDGTGVAAAGALAGESGMGQDGFVVEIALVVLLILVNAFFAGVEIAVVSARVTRLRTLAEDGNRRAEIVLRLKEDPDRFLATVQVGVTFVSTLASAVGGVAAIERLEPAIAALPWGWGKSVAEPVAVGAVVFTIAYLSLVVGELVPKSLAVRHAEHYALLVGPVIEWMSRFGRLGISALEWSSRILLRLLGQKDVEAGHFHSLEDLKAIAEEAGRQGVVRHGLVAGAVEFHEREVREVMTPRPRIAALQVNAPVMDAIARIRLSGHSRYPVYDSELDDFLGYVYARDVYEAALSGRHDGLAELCRPALSVHAAKAATSLLEDMRNHGIHVAFVVDEHGSLEGLVTLEDLVEVIVGEIRDEHHGANARIRKDGDVLEVEGTVPVYELNGDHDLDLPESDLYVTVAGLVLHRLGEIPTPGQFVDVEATRLTVTEVQGHRISRLRLEPAAVHGSDGGR